jgi:pimeloyl-ACP methyl ester carboxylesterase
MHSRRTFLSVTAAAIAGVGTAGCATDGAGTAPSKPKTFVLLHGAWHGGWCCNRVAEPLRAAGHRVYTPTQTGLGERSHLISKNVTLNVFVQDLENRTGWVRTGRESGSLFGRFRQVEQGEQLTISVG